MDKDFTTLSRVKASVNPIISKKSDSNHTKKRLTGNLIELSNQHKMLCKGQRTYRAMFYVLHPSESKQNNNSMLISETLFHIYMVRVYMQYVSLLILKSLECMHIMHKCR